LYVDQLKDLFNAENQLLKALPKMAKAATSPQLSAAFTEHLAETKIQIDRLETIFTELEVSPKGKTCKAMAGLLEEGAEAISEDADPCVRDAALIAAAQRVEHYEMAGDTAACEPLHACWAMRMPPSCCKRLSMKRVLLTKNSLSSQNRSSILKPSVQPSASNWCGG
jgi:hypothetical protein